MWRPKSFENRRNQCRLFDMVIIQLILLTSFVTLINGDEHASPRIIIVGCGASGIAAASKLFQNGFNNITILEAENRVGGRIHTVSFDGNFVDLGAQWVHGQKGNIAYELASPLGLLDDTAFWKYFDVYDSSGNRMDRNFMRDLQDNFLSKLDDIDNHNSSGSVGSYFRTEMNEYFAKHPEINETLREGFFELFNLWYVPLESADSWDDVSASEYFSYENCEGNHLVNWKERGYSTILDLLMKKIPNPEEELPVLNHTILNSEVENINYENPNEPVKVVTTDGKEYLADHVIFTTSLGVLKNQYATLFTPHLSEAKVNSIKGLEYGTACKVFLSFKEPWWPFEENFRGFLPFWSEEDKKELEDNPYKNWLLYNSGFFVPAHKPRVVEAWFSGKGARLLEHLPDDIVFNETLHMLHKFLGNHYNMSEPVGLARSKWYSNKHFRGTYTYQSLHTMELGASSGNLSEPVVRDTKPIILFAGEATSHRHFSTVHGAIETGFREAERIINFYPKPQ